MVEGISNNAYNAFVVTIVLVDSLLNVSGTPISN